MLDLSWYTIVSLTALLAIPAIIFVYSSSPAPLPPVPKSTDEKPKSIMQAPAETIPAPLDTPYTPAELSKYTTPETGIYVAVKGTIFDVTRKADVYGPGKSYSVFAGKDGSRGLGMSSLDPQNATDNLEGMDAKDLKVMEDWYAFFEKRYPIVGRVVKEGDSRL